MGKSKNYLLKISVAFSVLLILGTWIYISGLKIVYFEKENAPIIKENNDSLVLPENNCGV